MVYVLLYRNVSISGYVSSGDTSYVEGVFDNKEKVWYVIEKMFYNHIEKVQEQSYKIKSVIIKENVLRMDYENFPEDLYGTDYYEILEMRIQ